MSSQAVDSPKSPPKADSASKKKTEAMDEKKKGKGSKIWAWIKKNLLLILTILAVIVGVAAGLPLRNLEMSEQTVLLISFPGEIMMNMLKLIILPLLITSIVTNIAKLDPKQLGKMGLYAVCYYLATTVLAVILGICLVVAIHPGKPEQAGSAVHALTESYKNSSTVDTMLDLLRNMFPENVVAATVWTAQSQNGKIQYVRGVNVTGVIIVCIVAGILLAGMQKEKKPVVALLSSLEILTMRLVMVIMWYTPIGIVSLVMGKILEVKSFWGTLGGLGMYILTVMTGLAIHGFVTLPLIYFVFTRKNPLKFARGMLQALVTGLATSSSSAALPLSMQCLEKLGIDERIVRFMMPVGATINMDGTALYEATATIFIAQMYEEFDLTIGRIVVVSLTSTLASMGAAAVPSAGIITMMIVLSSIGLPQEAVATIIAVDWFLDRFRTTINIWGDAIGAGIVHHFVAKKLPPNEKTKKKSEDDGSDEVEKNEKETERKEKKSKSKGKKSGSKGKRSESKGKESEKTAKEMESKRKEESVIEKNESESNHGEES